MTDFAQFFDRHFEVKTHTHRHIRDESCRLRYQVYCHERAMMSGDGFVAHQEKDEFDSSSLHGIVQHRDSSQTMGTVRLVRSHYDVSGQRFPLEEAFPSLLPSHGLTERVLPRATTAEISRLAISKTSQQGICNLTGESAYPELSRAGGYFNGRCYPLVTFGLFTALMQMSVQHGITHWLAIMEPSLLRLLSRFGIAFQRIGGPLNFHGRRQPCYGRVADILARVRDVERDLFDLIDHHTSRVAQAGRQSPALPAAYSFLASTNAGAFASRIPPNHYRPLGVTANHAWQATPRWGQRVRTRYAGT